MDILFDADGDLHISPRGDILLGNSVAQKIRIRLLWFEQEWRWRLDEGLPYRSGLLVKNPDVDAFESQIRARIFDVKEVTAVRDVQITYDRKERIARIRYTALTDYETIEEEVILNAGLRSDG